MSKWINVNDRLQNKMESEYNKNQALAMLSITAFIIALGVGIGLIFGSIYIINMNSKMDQYIKENREMRQEIRERFEADLEYTVYTDFRGKK